MVAPYLAGMVRHATMDEMAKITDYVLIWHMDSHGLLTQDIDDDVQREEAEDEDSSTSDTSIQCTRDRDLPNDLLIPI